MTGIVPHIAVCICSYKRPALLERLLRELEPQETAGLFTFSVVVCDNAADRSAEPATARFAGPPLRTRYCVESRQNIALARNKAVENAEGDYIAFIDDDEFPHRRWLLTLFEALHQYNADGVLGPVKPHFDQKPPEWLVKGRFYERRSYPTGLVIDWQKGRTGNTLLKRSVFHDAGEQPFRPEHRTGEDQDFFGRMIEKGRVFVWCDEAVAWEVVPPIRWKRRFILKRTLFRGSLSPTDRDFGIRQVATSLVAVPVYIALLPVMALLGQHRAMSCLEKLLYHVGRLMALAGINPLRVPYVTE